MKHSWCKLRNGVMRCVHCYEEFDEGVESIASTNCRILREPCSHEWMRIGSLVECMTCGELR